MTRSAAVLSSLVLAALLAGCAPPIGVDDLLPVEAGRQGDDLLEVTVPDPADDLLPVDVRDPADDLLPVELRRDDIEELTGEELTDCLQGGWLLDNESWRAILVRLSAGSGATIESVTGQVVLQFEAGGRFSSLYDGWKIVTTTPEGRAEITREGEDSGSFVEDQGDLTLVEEASGSQVDGVVITGAGTIALPNVGDAEEQALFAESFPVLCTPDEMFAFLPDGLATFVRLF